MAPMPLPTRTASAVGDTYADNGSVTMCCRCTRAAVRADHRPAWRADAGKSPAPGTTGPLDQEKHLAGGRMGKATAAALPF